MSPTPEQVANRRRNRWMLVSLVALFFGGMLLAGLLRFSGWRPEGTKNKGELLQPYGDLREYTPTLADGTRLGWKQDPRTWRILVVPRECDAARTADCKRLMADLDKVWRLMGKDADRVQVLWAGAVPSGAFPSRQMRVLRVEDGLLAGLPGHAQFARGDATGDAAWLVDPNGFTIMRYAPGFDPGDVRTDLARLLKIN